MTQQVSSQKANINHIDITVVDPKGRKFRMRIDAQIDPKELFKGIVRALGLPNKNYVFYLVDEIRIKDGSVLIIAPPELDLEKTEIRN